jgi:nucleotide-binding universal stress UspA family protein
MYTHALIPLDGSDLAECALNHLKAMLKDGSMREATLLNVVKVDLPWMGDNEERSKQIYPNINMIREQAFEASRKYLASVESRLAADGITVRTESLEANKPDHAITDYAREKGLDLIIIATHGYTGMKKMLLGSIASGVLHQSSVPVLLIRPEACQI